MEMQSNWMISKLNVATAHGSLLSSPQPHPIAHAIRCLLYIAAARVHRSRPYIEQTGRMYKYVNSSAVALLLYIIYDLTE